MRGRRPAATSSSSPASSPPPPRVTVTGPPGRWRRTDATSVRVRTPMPSASKAAATSWPANGSSRASRRPPRTTTVTSSLPRRRNAWASSQPTGPPPSTTSRPGTSLAPVAPRLSQGRASARPGTGGIAGALPVASTTARLALRVRRPPPASSTWTVRSPASRPVPLTSSIPSCSTQSSAPSSFQLEVM